jgi:cation/acetate symporter
MTYEASPLAIALFLFLVSLVLWLSFYFAKKTRDSKGYFAASGRIHWFVNGIAFAGDYLSAASFLGIAGMIATFGYDGFLYSIGFLAGWIVALFVVAEPLKRMGKYTFSDALDARFNSKSIQLTAGISTLVVSVCYLVPQMVGAGALMTPLLGMPHFLGVLIVGAIVITIVSTAGMVSTTYVQFIKGGMLIVFSTVMVVAILSNGLSTTPSEDFRPLASLSATVVDGEVTAVADARYQPVGQQTHAGIVYVKLESEGVQTWWVLSASGDQPMLEEALSRAVLPGGTTLYNGRPREDRAFFQVGNLSRIVVDGQEVEDTGSLGPLQFLSVMEASDVVRFASASFRDGDSAITVWRQVITPGERIMRPGLNFKVDEGSTTLSKLNFASLMLALFLGTAALPHILIRYYTVPSQRDARKSTVVAIIGIGFFYILTLFMGLGAMVSGVLDVENSNMAAPLLAQRFGTLLFAIISAIAFATVLGTVSGLIVAASGAVAHDLADNFLGIRMTDARKVRIGRIAAVGVGALAVLLGILFQNVNVSFLVGLAFAVAASANFPSLFMLLFWKRTTAKGIAASIMVGVVSSLTIILLSPSMYTLYGMDAASAPIPLDNPGIITIPLARGGTRQESRAFTYSKCG